MAAASLRQDHDVTEHAGIGCHRKPQQHERVLLRTDVRSWITAAFQRLRLRTTATSTESSEESK